MMRKLLAAALVFWLSGSTLSANRHEGHITTEDDEPFAQLGESSARLYARKQFKVKNPDGSEFEYQVKDDGISVTLTGGAANGAATLVIPASVEALGSYFFVTDIGERAFMSETDMNEGAMDGVNELIISEGITSAGQNCFRYARDLTTVSIPSTLRNLPSGMFADCPDLRQVCIPKDSQLEETGWYVFRNCPMLETIHLPDNVTKCIAVKPWLGCTWTVRIPQRIGG